MCFSQIQLRCLEMLSLTFTLTIIWDKDNVNASIQNYFQVQFSVNIFVGIIAGNLFGRCIVQNDFRVKITQGFLPVNFIWLRLNLWTIILSIGRAGPKPSPVDYFLWNHLEVVIVQTTCPE